MTNITAENIGIPGSITSGAITLIGKITDAPAGSEVFDFLSSGVAFALRVEDWEFHADVPQPKPGWYSHNEYPVTDGYSPVWLDGSGGTWTFSLKKQDGDGKTEPLLFKMEVPWDQLTALEQPDAAAPQE